MNRRIVIPIVAVHAIVLLFLVQAASSQQPATKDGKRLLTALDALKIHAVGSPVLSPDGKKIAYTVSDLQMESDKPWTTITRIWVVPAAGGDSRQFTGGDKSATNPDWSPDGRYLAFLTNRDKEEERQVWFMQADGGEAWKVTDHKGGVSSFGFSPDGKRLVFTAADQQTKEEEQQKKDRQDAFHYDRDFKQTHIWTWDIDKKEEKRLTEGSFNCGDPQWSPDGTRITFTAAPSPRADDAGLSDIWVVDAAGGERKKLTDNPGSDSSARWSPDGQWIAYVANRSTNNGVTQSHLYAIPAGGGTPRLLTDGFDLDASTPAWSRDGKTVYFVSNARQDAAVFACEFGAASTRRLTNAMGTISISDSTVAGDVIAGIVSTPQKPGEVYRADSGFRSVQTLTDHSGNLKEYALGNVEILSWKSVDGTAIEGVLTKPAGFDPGRKYPLLLNPHGGPTGASLANFNASAQLMAANGYLVLQPNFRGSTGRGEKFAAANKNTWGKGDYEDCMTGVDAVIAKGWADPDRLGAFGWSYGGYMTFWILTQTDRFKAVSPGAGLTNIYSMYSQNDIQRYLQFFYGDKAPWDNFDLYWDRSPMKYIKQVKTPTLILHGQMDTRVPVAQAQEFYRALVEMKVPVDFVLYPREGHGFREPRHNLDRMRRYLAFFGKYLNNPPVTETEAELKALR